MSFFSGLDVGQQADYTALAILQVIEHDEDGFPVMMVVHLERMRAIEYPAQVMRVQQRLLRPPLWNRTELVVDATGVGKGVADIFHRLEVNFTGVIITGGETEHKFKKKQPMDPTYYSVPKSTLVASALIPFQQGRLKISKYLDHGAILKDELRGFRLKQNTRTGHESFAHREGEHDDLVLAVAMASWSAHRMGSAMPDESLSSAVTPYREQDLWYENDLEFGGAPFGF